MNPVVLAVGRSATHSFSKPTEAAIRLLAGLGVEGDAHQGRTVQHLARLARDPTAPNLRQVHLLQAELFDELRAAGFAIAPGQMGENVTTRGIDLLGLAAGTRLRLGHAAVVEVTGLRNPCRQIDDFRPGLMAAVLVPAIAGPGTVGAGNSGYQSNESVPFSRLVSRVSRLTNSRKPVQGRDAQGNLVRKAGVMAIVLAGGDVAPGDAIRVELPPPPHRPLAPV